jgi:N-acetylmuramic acid 6-phosphate etherase
MNEGNRMSDRSTEARHPGSAGLHTLSGRDALTRLLDAQLAAAEALRPALGALERAAEAAAAALMAGHRMAYAGAGSSGLMALADCLELAGTFGIAPDRTPLLFAGGAAALLHMTGGVEDDAGLAQADVARLAPRPGDVVICLAASGSTPYTRLVAEAARAAGATVIGISNTAGAPLLALADIAVLLDTGPEVVAGSTRLGAATAQKIALNMLSVLVGIRLGHVHDGYMVNLVADNAKLVDRAARIVAGIAGTGTEAARGALAQTGGAVKPAVLIARGAAPADAQAALAASHGHLAAALDRITTQS